MMRLFHAAYLLAVLAGTPNAWAVNEISVEVTVGGGSPTTTLWNTGADITVTLGNVSTNTLIRIFDNTVSGGTPTYSAGKVTIDGTVSSGTPILRVLVAGANQTTFPTLPDSLINQGLINIGGSGTGAGIKVYNSGNGGDTTLRDRTRRVALA
ncbi:MAG: hypothetical protein HBSAPP03_10030 [Phycisphaerae bacterium]|nr:MAG: hypothetical protein HBSAPP03_10030 [Phycisphaerae bacterium]